MAGLAGNEVTTKNEGYAGKNEASKRHPSKRHPSQHKSKVAVKYMYEYYLQS